jgi:hypothetical protein
MAFTGLEFFRGLCLAFLWATGLISLAWTVAAFPYGLYSLMWVVPAAGAGAIVFAAPAWLLGQLLRRVRPLRWHVIAFATLGAVVGVVTTLAFLAWSGGPGPYIGGPLNVIYAINVSLSAAAVALGWWRPPAVPCATTRQGASPHGLRLRCPPPLRVRTRVR